MRRADSTDVALTLHLCDLADEISSAAFRRPDLVVESKVDMSPVSEADRAVELALRGELRVLRPSDHIVGEEYGEESPGSAASAGGPVRRWIIDPIDGTVNFVRNFPMWATLIALEEDGEVIAGAVSAPALRRRWWAGRGHGAFVASLDEGGSTQMHVSKVTHLANAYVLGSALSSWKPPRSPSGYIELTSRALWDRGLGDFWSHMLVAEGCAEVGVDPIGNLWDLAPLQVIVEEAGGTFTDLDGRPRADGGHGVSTNGLLHSEVLAILGGSKT